MPDMAEQHEYDILLPTLKANRELGMALTDALLKIKDLEQTRDELLAACIAARDELRRIETAQNEISSVQLGCIEAINKATGGTNG